MSPDRDPGGLFGALDSVGHVLRHDERVMGTVVSFDVRHSETPSAVVRQALRRACAGLARADAVFSLWKTDSPMSRLRRGEAEVEDLPSEVAEVLELCNSARRLSGGWFDPWSMPGGLDPTGLVKGWAAARALAPLMDAAVDGAMVNAGGDVASFGRPRPGASWRIGVTDPFDRSRLLCVVESPGAVATSGTYERGAHLIDPFTGKARTRWRSATVVGADLALADALATGLCVAGAEGAAAIEAVGYGAIVVDDAGTVRLIGNPPFAKGRPKREDLSAGSKLLARPESTWSAPGLPG